MFSTQSIHAHITFDAPGIVRLEHKTILKAGIKMLTPQKSYSSSFPDTNESFKSIDFLAHLAEAGSKDFSTSKVQPLQNF